VLLGDGLEDGPENVTHSVPEVQPLAGLSQASTAVMVSLKKEPAVWVPGLGTVKEFSPAALTVKLPVEPVLPDGEVTEVTVKEVDWAS
jgi:hypothetical protein